MINIPQPLAPYSFQKTWLLKVLQSWPQEWDCIHWPQLFHVCVHTYHNHFTFCTKQTITYVLLLSVSTFCNQPPLTPVCAHWPEASQRICSLTTISYIICLSVFNDQNHLTYFCLCSLTTITPLLLPELILVNRGNLPPVKLYSILLHSCSYKYPTFRTVIIETFTF